MLQVEPVPAPELARLLALAEPVQARRKELLTQAGQVARYLYFVEAGIQRSYHLHEGKEHTLAFTYAPSFCAIPESLLLRAPSPHFLECLTPSRLLRLPYEPLDVLLRESPALEHLFRRLTELLLVGTLQRHTELLAYSMAERFAAFLRRSPHLLTAVPHKHLALGIDATNFSKLLSGYSVAGNK